MTDVDAHNPAAALLSRIRCVLVETSHPGNIGAAARAMKNMGLSQLVLVSPKQFPDEEATARAAGATDLLESAVVVESLAEALSGCALSFGTTARPRRLSNAAVSPRRCAEQGIAYLHAHGQADIGLVFGRERSGLSNDELDLCQLPLNIPTNPDYSSLNLGAAVQLLSYEMRVAALGEVSSERPPRELASHDEMEGLFGALEQAMVHVGFLKPENPRLLLRRIRQLFNRAALDSEEVQLLRGFVAKVLRGRV